MTGFTNGTVFNWIVDGIFFYISAEPSIKNNKNAAVILVNIFIIGAMMGTVIGWGIKDILNPFGEFPHGFGMDKELINKIKRVKEEYPDRMYTK